jgi:hypothetical protein
MEIRHIVLDCLDNERLAAFWCAATGYVRRRSAGPYVVLGPPTRESPLPLLLLQRVPDPKMGKNRVHLDLGGEEMDAAVERLVELGATKGPVHDENGIRWTVMADPEGNEFCVMAR